VSVWPKRLFDNGAFSPLWRLAWVAGRDSQYVTARPVANDGATEPAPAGLGLSRLES
jgi:hypothetical protein